MELEPPGLLNGTQNTTDPSRENIAWYGSALLLLLSFGIIALASPRLSPTIPPADRPLLLLVTCLLLASFGYAAAYWLATRKKGSSQFWLIIVVGLAVRCMFLPTPLIQSDDAYRYVLDGQTVKAGINPFRYTPSEIVSAAPAELIGDHPDAAWQIITRVNNPDVPTIYPPLAQLAFWFGVVRIPWNIVGQRWVFLLCDLLSMALIAYILRRLHKPQDWIVLYAWNPLVLKEISNSAHVDALAALVLVLLMAALSVWSRSAPHTFSGDLKAGSLAGFLTGCAVCTKLYPLALLPPVCAYLWIRHRRITAAMVALAVSLMTVAASYAPFMDVGLQRLTEGLQTYWQHWTNNPGAFDLLDYLFDEPRIVWLAIMGCVSLSAALCLRFSAVSVDRLIWAVQTTLLTWLLLSPACFPWYALGLVAISALRPRGWLVALSTMLVLYYGVVYGKYQEYGDAWAMWVRVVEHGVIWLSLCGAIACRLFAINRRLP